MLKVRRYLATTPSLSQFLSNPRSLIRHSSGEAAWLVIKERWIRWTTQALLVAYTLFLLKPVMPVIIDGLAHAFWKNVHVAVVHKVNGKEHVHYELKKVAAENEKHKGGQKDNSPNSEDVYQLPVAVKAVSGVSYMPYSCKPAAYYLRTPYDADLRLESPPPKESPVHC